MIKKDRQISPIKQYLADSKKRSVADVEHTGNFKLSFQYLDTTQECCSTFEDWQREGVQMFARRILFFQTMFLRMHVGLGYISEAS